MVGNWFGYGDCWCVSLDFASRFMVCLVSVSGFDVSGFRVLTCCAIHVCCFGCCDVGCSAGLVLWFGKLCGIGLAVCVMGWVVFGGCLVCWFRFWHGLWCWCWFVVVGLVGVVALCL